METADGTVRLGPDRTRGRSCRGSAASSAESGVTIEKAKILQRLRLDQSNMPAGTVNVLQKEQVLDLLAFPDQRPPTQETGATMKTASLLFLIVVAPVFVFADEPTRRVAAVVTE